MQEVERAVPEASAIECVGFRGGCIVIRLKDGDKIMAEAQIGFDEAVALADQLVDLVERLEQMGSPTETPPQVGHA
jgi:hypothetical protein